MLLRKHKRLIIFFAAVLFVCAAALTGLMFAQNEPRIVQKDDEDEDSSVFVGTDDAAIEDDAVVTWDYAYSMCGHHIYVECAVDKDMVGLNFTQLQEEYPDIHIVSFEADALVLKKTFYCYCPHHYILKRFGEELAIYRTMPGTDDQYIYLEIPVSFDTLEQKHREVLSVGKVFCSLEDLESYIEDIET